MFCTADSHKRRDTHRDSTKQSEWNLTIATYPQDEPRIVTSQFTSYGGRIPTCPDGVRFHIQQESDIPASTQLYNQICFCHRSTTLSARPSLSSTRQLACRPDYTATRSARCIASWKPMAWWKPWRAQGSTFATSRNLGKAKYQHIRNRGVTDLDWEVRKCIDGLLNAGCTPADA